MASRKHKHPEAIFSQVTVLLSDDEEEHFVQVDCEIYQDLYVLNVGYFLINVN